MMNSKNWFQHFGIGILLRRVKIISIFLNCLFNIGNIKFYIYCNNTARSNGKFYSPFICVKGQQVQSCTYYFLGSSDFQLFLR